MINWNKYLSIPELFAWNTNLNHLVEPSFQRVNILFVLAFAVDTQRISSKRYLLPNVEVKNYNAMIDRKNFFDEPINNDIKTYENIRKIATGQGDDYTTGCLLDYSYFSWSKSSSRTWLISYVDKMSDSKKYIYKILKIAFHKSVL